MNYSMFFKSGYLTLIIATLLLAVVCQPVLANKRMAAKPQAIPIEDFFRNPEIATYRISPDGSKFSYLKPVNNRLNIFVQTIGENNARQVTNVTKRDIRNYFWKSDKMIIYAQDSNGDENLHIYATDVLTGETRDLTPFAGVRAEIIDELPDNEAEILIGTNQRNPEIFDVYRLVLATGEMKLEVENPGNFIDYLTDHQGVVRIACGKDRDTGDNLLYYRQTADQPFRLILSTKYRDDAEPIGFDSTSKKLYMLSNVGRDKLALVIFNPDRGKEEEVLLENPEVDIAGIVMSKKTKELLYASYTTDRTHYRFFNKEASRIHDCLKSRFNGNDFTVVSANKNEDKYIVAENSDIRRGSYYLYESSADKLTKIADLAPWLNEDQMSNMQPIQYTSRDGYTIHGYLTLPKGRTAKNLPVILLPHGGPWARDYWGYDSEVQFLANRGYAVLQMNFRGSTGYGKAFVDAGNKEWGKKMQDDITDGANWLVAQGIADPKRIGIYGGSYGGYAVLAGLAFTPDLYACGVDLVGPSNLFTLIASEPAYWRPMIAEFYERVGNPEKDYQLLRDVSPIFHADKIKVPLFVAQGANDPRVTKDESDQIVNALKERGIPVTYMLKADEGHGFSNEENRLDFYKAMEKFLSKYLQPEN